MMGTEMHNSLAVLLELTFQDVQDVRMADVPILNPDLSVKAIGFEDNGEADALGVLITPWFMNVMKIPRDQMNTDIANMRVGKKVTHSFPAGELEFLVAEEEAIGRYLTCSLFSPMFDFKDQETAEHTARVALETLMQTPDADEVDEDAEMRQVWRGELPQNDNTAKDEPAPPQDARPEPRPVSRREFLRGRTKTSEKVNA